MFACNKIMQNTMQLTKDYRRISKTRKTYSKLYTKLLQNSLKENEDILLQIEYNDL